MAKKKSATSRSGSAKTARAATGLTADMRVAALVGSDAFLRLEEAKNFAKLLETTFKGLETFRFDGESVDLATLLDELRSFGLMQRHKLVILDAADEFLAGEPTRRAALERYLAQPVEDATLLLRARSMKEGKLEKALAAAGAMHSCDPPGESGAAKWCVKRCERAYKVTIEPAAATMLVQRLGVDLAHLDSELGKLANAVDPNMPITVREVQAMVGLSREEKVWVLEAAILSGDPGRALAQQRQLQDVSRVAEELVRWVQLDVCRKLHAVGRLVESNRADTGSMRAAGVYQPQGQQAMRRAATPPAARFAHLLRRTVQTDAAAKSGRADIDRSLEAMTALIADSI